MEEKATYIHTTDVHNLNAPSKVVPLLMEMFAPKSVLDVGCGIGTWLSVFSLQGIKDVFGVDGDFVDRNLLETFIDKTKFLAADLKHPFHLQRRFDLVLSLEVAEHLPESSADSFVETLCLHSDTIVFSAAIPGQGGQNHINEQWKAYWVEKFRKHGYQPFDLLRPKIWEMPEVDWWYKQNMLVFSSKNLTHLLKTAPFPLEAIHPQLFQQHLEYIVYLQQYVQELEMKIYKSELSQQ